jgi:hypothetical protein
MAALDAVEPPAGLGAFGFRNRDSVRYGFMQFVSDM